jgi:hypothetical protein
MIFEIEQFLKTINTYTTNILKEDFYYDTQRSN